MPRSASAPSTAIRALFLLTLVSLFALAGCGDDPAGPGASGSMSLSVFVPAGGSGAASIRDGRGPSLDLVQNDGSHELVVTRAAVVLREIELERQDEECPDDDTAGEDSGDDACEEFEVGPVLVELPLDGTVQRQVTVSPPAGSYDEVEFEIHKPDDGNPDDQAFVDDHPMFADVSIRVEGTFDGEPFTFTSRIDEEQEIELSPPIVVNGGGDTNVTLVLDVSTWFVDPATRSLVDPRTAEDGQENASVVSENIERSIEAFEDEDEDGDDDSEEDDGS